MRTFLALAIFIGMTVSTHYHEHHIYSRLKMYFPEEVQYQIVDYLRDPLSQEGTLTFHNHNLTVHIGKNCAFSGDFVSRKHLNIFKFVDFTSSTGLCTAEAREMQRDLKSIEKKGDGFAMRIQVFNSDWVVIGIVNHAGKQIDLVIAQRAIPNENSAGEHFEIHEENQ